MLKYILWAGMLISILVTVAASISFTRLLKQNSNQMLGRLEGPLAKRLRIMTIGIIGLFAFAILWFILY